MHMARERWVGQVAASSSIGATLDNKMVARTARPARNCRMTLTCGRIFSSLPRPRPSDQRARLCAVPPLWLVTTILREPERVHQLQESPLYLRNQLRKHDIPLVDGTSDSTPIIPIFIGDEADAVRISHGLSERGFHVPGIRYPTVARGRAILRVTTMATHTRDDLDHLVDALRDLMPHSV